MALRPEDWNVVVLGRWNPALFTPAGISQRVFRLPEATPIEVYVVLDDIQLPRVRHAGVMIAASSGQLVISPDRCTFNELGRARDFARDAIKELPKTPLIAAAYNIRYRADTMPASLAQRFSNDLDKRFSDSDFQIVGRQFHRLLSFRAGRLLVRVTQEPDSRVELLINFELLSKNDGSLCEWLEVPIAEIRTRIEQVLDAALQLREEDYVIEHDEHAGEQRATEPTASRG